MPGLDDDYIMSSKVQTLSIQFGIVQRLESCHDQFMHQVKLVDLVCDKTNSTVSSSIPGLKPPDTDTGLLLSPLSPLSGPPAEDSGLLFSPVRPHSGPPDEDSGLCLSSPAPLSETLHTNNGLLLSPAESPNTDSGLLSSPETSLLEPSNGDSGLFSYPTTPLSELSCTDNDLLLSQHVSNTSTNTCYVDNKCSAILNDIELEDTGDASSVSLVGNANATNVDNNLYGFNHELSVQCGHEITNNSVVKHSNNLTSKTFTEDEESSTVKYMDMDSSIKTADSTTEDTNMTAICGDVDETIGNPFKEIDAKQDEEAYKISNQCSASKDDSGLGEDSNQSISFSAVDFKQENGHPSFDNEFGDQENYNVDSASQKDYCGLEDKSNCSDFVNLEDSVVSSQKEGSGNCEESSEFKSYSSVDFNHPNENGSSAFDSQSCSQGNCNDISDTPGQGSLKRRILEDRETLSECAQSECEASAWKLAKVDDSDITEEEEEEENPDWTFLYEDSLLSPIIEENACELSCGSDKRQGGYFANKQNRICDSGENQINNATDSVVSNNTENVENDGNCEIVSSHSNSSDDGFSLEENYVTHCEIFLQGTHNNKENVLTRGSDKYSEEFMEQMSETPNLNPDLEAQPHDPTDNTSQFDLEMQQFDFNPEYQAFHLKNELDNKTSCVMDKDTPNKTVEHSLSEDMVNNSLCDVSSFLDVEAYEDTEKNSSANGTVCEFDVNENLSMENSSVTNVCVNGSNGIKTSELSNDEPLSSVLSNTSESMSRSVVDETSNHENPTFISVFKPKELCSSSNDVSQQGNIEGDSYIFKEQAQNVHKHPSMSRNEWTVERDVLSNTENQSSSATESNIRNRKISESSSQLYVSRLKEKFEQSENTSTKNEEYKVHRKSNDKNDQFGLKLESKCKSLENLLIPSVADSPEQNILEDSSVNKSVNAAQAANRLSRSAEPTDLSSCGHLSFHKSLLDVRSTNTDSSSVLNRGVLHHRSMHDIKNSDKESSSDVNNDLHSKCCFSFHEIKKLFEHQDSYSCENKQPPSQGTEWKVSSNFQTPLSKEEEVIQDGQTVFRAKDEKRYSDSFTDRSDHDVKQDFSTPHYLANEQMQQKGVGQYNQNFAGETVSREEVHVSEMNTFETEQEEGVYENEPQKRSDVVRESDRNIAEGLPEIGMAKNLLNKFAHITDQPAEPKRKELTPPDSIDGPVEYVSEPRSTMEMYQGRPEAGVFENQPAYNPDIMRSGGAPEDILPERGMARNVASKFKELEKSGSSGSHTSGKREITPDREGGKVEFVSEPRGYVEKYEGRAESGVFENEPGHIDNVVKSGEQIEEELPERGYAKNIASKFKQLESGTAPSPDKGRKKEMTPDRSTKVEYVSEPRGYVETYEGKAEAGVFENQPYSPTTEVIKCDQPISDEPLPEKGYAQHIAAKFREMESSAKSPPPTPVRIKEITPPRDDGNVSQNSGVFESQPQVLPDVVRSEDNTDDIVPQTGYAKSLVSRFKQLEAESSKTVTSSKQKREITPPKGGSGVFENQPKQFIPEYNRQAESGILENNPEHIEGVIKESDPPKFEEELPERGMAKNLVSRWKQMENHGSTQSATAKQRIKEFTPPREEERVKAARSPRSPSGGQSQSFQQENLPNQAGEPSVFESEPGIRDDVFREADTDWMEGMPKSNTTKKMLEKFKHIQEEAKKQPPKPVPKSEEQGDSSRESPSRNETKVCSRKASYRDTVDHSEVPAVRSENIADAKKSGGYMVAVQAEKCGVCGKSVYAMERLEMNKVVYHKTCFKCSQCKATLTPKTFAVNNGIMFCTNHYKQLFARKGNYDEGFGREQHKKKWRSEPSLTDSEQEAT
ncbi:serine-rich adhesin for platelets-like isoform X3 [Gigantopelta aegis]|uniref:serine-rich adhesin for platelets-like isoform X3 n=1 Tax=Gigantopelta aegis TaxID=1735272 RepID=UPI001B8891C7|nr:serine-rich adhesin for platelets-like isoform X3 [Gigantopelta aegis]